MDPFVAELPIPKVSLEQFAGVVSYAGEFTTNLLVAGGSALTLRLGHYHRRQDETSGQLVEEFVPGPDPARDEALLQAVCFTDPANGASDVNPFTTTLWPITTGLKPTTIEQAMSEKLQALPPYAVLPGYFSLEMQSTDAMYIFKKNIASIFAVAVTRGSLAVGFVLQRGTPVEIELPATRVVKVPEEVDERMRDANGNLIFEEATENGKPVYEAILAPRTGVPLHDPATGEVRKRRKLIYKTRKVMRDTEKIESTVVRVRRTPVYVQVERTKQIDRDDFLNLSANEGTYDPTWMLADVLAGKCADKKPFHGMEGV